MSEEKKRVGKRIVFSALKDLFEEETQTFLGKVGMKLIIVRRLDGTKQQHKCTIKEITDKGAIHTWDETIEQWFSFEVSDLVKKNLIAKILS